jgi:hypothetical protein
LLPHARTFASVEAILLFTAEGRLHHGAETISAQPLDAIRVHEAQDQRIALEGDGIAWVIGLSR